MWPRSRGQSREETRAWSLRSKHLRGDWASRHVCPLTEPAKQAPSQDLVDKAMTSRYLLGRPDRTAAAPSREVFSTHLSLHPSSFWKPCSVQRPHSNVTSSVKPSPTNAGGIYHSSVIPKHSDIAFAQYPGCLSGCLTPQQHCELPEGSTASFSLYILMAWQKADPQYT